jgi:hypothetical protein
VNREAGLKFDDTDDEEISIPEKMAKLFIKLIA